MNKALTFLEKNVPRFLAGTLAVIVALLIVSLVSKDNSGEAAKGDFSSKLFNDGWEVFVNKEPVSDATIPGTVEAQAGDSINMVNTLPDDIHDGMSIMFRTAMQDIYIFVDGIEKESYVSYRIDKSNYYGASAYVVANLSSKDAGKKIEVILGVKSKGVLENIRLCNGNNGWFEILYDNLILNILAVIMMVLGAMVMSVFFFLKKRLENNNSVFYLGVLMADIGTWMISESRIRQLIMAKPSVTAYYSYLTIESIGAYAVMFFDAVQHKKYHKYNVILEGIICVQLLVNVILNFSGVMYFHDSLIFSHIWMVLAIMSMIVEMVLDVIHGTHKTYKVVFAGMLGFIISCSMELVVYYRNAFNKIGLCMCAGLLILLVTTVMQVVLDVVASYDARERQHEEMTNKTLETIASSIDAKDEYTGGHSYRVGLYASIIARAMAKDYGFSDEDIVRINYIGLMHDIGKIGVADPILNKAGKLTNEEFSLMKKHVDIGYELLGAMGESVPELLEGIRYHHERYDGKGYPDGLQGENIPLIARILCVADCYDAMTSNRVYRTRLTDEQVRNEFIRCRGTQFDPKLTDIFIDILDRGEVKPDTVDGMETGDTGRILKSSTLEARLSQNLINGDMVIPNPEHIRMLCYIAKLMEKKGSRVDMIMAGYEGHDTCKHDDNSDEMSEALAPFLKRHDINIEYTESTHVIAMFDRTDAEMDLFVKSMKAIDGMQIEII